MTTHLTHRSLAALAVLTVLTITACGSDAGQDSAGPDSSSASGAPSSTAGPGATATSEPDPTTSSAGSEGSAPDRGTDATSKARASGSVQITVAGAEVAVGDTVTVPATHAMEEFVLRLTVTAIEQGSSADLEGIGLKEDPETLVPYYIRVTGQLVSGDGANYDPAADLDGLSGERTASPLIPFGDFAPCEDRAFPAEARRGSVVESCTTAVVEAGEEVDAAMYSASNTDYDMFDGKPVIWR